MTLAEVMVSALILSISAQTSLQGWGRSSAAVTAADALQVQSWELEVFRLASLRLLQDADPAVLFCLKMTPVVGSSLRHSINCWS